MRRVRRTIKTPARFDDADFYSSAIIGVRVSSHLLSTPVRELANTQSTPPATVKQSPPKTPISDIGSPREVSDDPNSTTEASDNEPHSTNEPSDDDPILTTSKDSVKHEPSTIDTDGQSNISEQNATATISMCLPTFVKNNNNNTSNDCQSQQSLAKTKSSESQFYPAPINTFDVASSALIIDRMIAHLTKECENMTEWIQLKKQRLEMERVRREQEAELELRREKLLLDGMARMQQQMFEFMTKMEKKETQKQRVDRSSPQKQQSKTSPMSRHTIYATNLFNRKSNVIDRSKVKSAIPKSDHLSSYIPQ